MPKNRIRTALKSSVRMSRLAAIPLAAAYVFAAPTQAPARAQTASQASYSVDAEVAAALYNASATQAAMERQYSKQLFEARQQIDALRKQIKAAPSAADNSGRVEELESVVAAKQREIIDLLAQLDEAYAREVSTLEEAFENIASTPEGLRALDMFNNGDQLAAITVLDELRAAKERARQAELDRANAMDARSIAYLALEAIDSGTLTTAQVIDRFEEVTRLDPTRFRDWMVLGDLYKTAGDLGQASAALDQAETLASGPAERAEVLVASSEVAMDQGNLSRAKALLAGASDAWKSVLSSDPDSIPALDGMAAMSMLIGELNEDQGDLRAARRAYEDAEAHADRLVALEPDNPNFTWRESSAVAFLGFVDGKEGNEAGKREKLNQALALREAVLERVPGLPRVRLGISSIKATMGGFDALSDHRALLTELLETDPGNTEWQHTLAITNIRLAGWYNQQVDLVSASDHFEEAVGLLEALVETEPTNTNWLLDLQYALTQHAAAFVGFGDYKGGEAAERKAESALLRVLAIDSGNVRAQTQLAWSRIRLAGMLMGQKKYDAANALFDESIAEARALQEREQTRTAHAEMLAVALQSSALPLRLTGRSEEAVARYIEAEQIWSGFVAESPGDDQALEDLATCRRFLATHYRDEKQFDQAETYARKSHLALQSLAEQAPSDIGRQRDVQKSHSLLGSIARDRKDYETALAEYQTALSINQRLLENDLGNIELTMDAMDIKMMVSATETDLRLQQLGLD
ncbi:hypothetical protein D1227_01695 [Henriciella mobilis]|nr:hypothetical protein D1231_01960 [Henriciella mobilis]RIJ25095.1 hypothetical protein D1227_01695 [Henriciella mobilis]